MRLSEARLLDGHLKKLNERRPPKRALARLDRLDPEARRAALQLILRGLERDPHLSKTGVWRRAVETTTGGQDTRRILSAVRDALDGELDLSRLPRVDPFGSRKGPKPASRRR